MSNGRQDKHNGKILRRETLLWLNIDVLLWWKLSHLCFMRFLYFNICPCCRCWGVRQPGDVIMTRWSCTNNTNYAMQTLTNVN